MDTLIYIAIITALAITVIILSQRLKKIGAENGRLGMIETGGLNGDDLFRELSCRIAMIVKSGKAALWDLDVKANKLNYLVTNDSTFKDGLKLEEYLELVHPEDRKHLSEKIQKLSEGEGDAMEATFRMALDGESYRWYDLIAMIYQRDTENRPVIVSGIRWDITDYVKLEESKTIMELAFTARGFLPWSFDVKTGLLYSDNEDSVFYNKKYTIYEYMDQIVHPDYKGIVNKTLNEIQQGLTDEINIKVLTSYDGKYEWTHITGKAVDNHNGKAARMVGTSQFITKEVEREAELVALREKAEKENELKSVFLSNMSHEIRTPLNAIIGFSKLIAETEDKEEIRDYSQIIESNNNLLLRLIDDVLDITKIEAGYMEFTYSDTDIPTLFHELEQVYSYKMPEGVELKCDIPDEIFVISTEKNRVTQVMNNFINNAIKYTSEGCITIGYSHEPKGTRFFVRDTGKGISEEDLPKVFERFAKFDRNVKGTGLGLSISETIIEKLNGKIGVMSELGRGSEFWFVLPQ